MNTINRYHPITLNNAIIGRINFISKSCELIDLKTSEVCARNKTGTILKRHVKEKKNKGENEQFSNGLVDDKNGTI